jgi:hypothetical protein
LEEWETDEEKKIEKSEKGETVIATSKDGARTT